MKRLTLAIMLSFASGATFMAPATFANTEYTTEETQVASYSDAQLDSLLAPIALYPDTILTHILIASTYPLDVIAADRWRQKHPDLDAPDIEQAIESFNWDPSVKALVPFSDILKTLSNDLDWLQALGDNVLISQSRVLARVQVLRQHALNAGTLADNDYQRVDRDSDVIVIEPVRKEVVYVPYYDTRIIYGTWWHPAVAPVYWHHPGHYHLTAGFYWSPSIRLSTTFYFGGISWHDRHVIVTRRPVKRYYYGSDIKRSYSRDYQPWQHSVEHRRVRYSNNVVHTNTARYVNHTPTIKRRVDYTSAPHKSTKVVSSTTVINRTSPETQKREQRYVQPKKDTLSRTPYSSADKSRQQHYAKPIDRQPQARSVKPRQSQAHQSASGSGNKEHVNKGPRIKARD